MSSEKVRPNCVTVRPNSNSTAELSGQFRCQVLKEEYISSNEPMPKAAMAERTDHPPIFESVIVNTF